MSAYSGYPRHQYTCVDRVPVGYSGGSAADENGALLYPQELNWIGQFVAGYVDGREATCAFCASTGATRGATYVRYGQYACSASSVTLYSGVTGGSFYSDVGGGPDYMCMPPSPTYDSFTDGTQGGGRIFYTEYELTGSGVVRHRGLQDREVPCAYCEATGRRTSFMFPARYTCPNRFTLDYMGFMVAPHNSQRRSEFSCMDYEAVTGRNTAPSNENGALFYPVQVNDFPLGFAYQQFRELSCARCSTDEGIVFTRWGRRECPQGSLPIYAGWAGAAHYTHTGSSHNRLCMPDVPEYSPNAMETTTGDEGGALIYRMEYQTSGYGLASLAFLHDEDVPCALCLTEAPSVFTQWGGGQHCPYGAYVGEGESACARERE